MQMQSKTDLYPKGDNEMYDKKPVASWVFAFKGDISWEEWGWGGLNAFFFMHLCASIFVLIDDFKRENVHFSKKRYNDSKVLVVSVIGEYLSVSFYCY